jgi:uncharacterized protein
MKPLVIFHDHCTDGFGAAFAAWMKFGDEAEYRACSYGVDQYKTIDGFISYYGALKDRTVYIIDFSFPREVTDWVLTSAKTVVWLDHHKTAFEMWLGNYEKGLRHLSEIENDYVLLDDNKSGAMLAWEYFHPGTEVPMMIKHIDDRDRWQFKIEGSKEFHSALASYKPWSFEQWKELNDQMQHWDDIVGPHFIFKEGSAILRAHEQNVKSVVAGSRRDVRVLSTSPKTGGEHWECIVDVDATGLAVNCPPHLASDVGHELANESGTFGLCWYMGRYGKAKVSLRSNGDYDVSAIAKSFGGGGHRNAAGMEVDMLTLMGWMK